jgi:heme/copper-type cytochrome/quinol oxidase subunit 2
MRRGSSLLYVLARVSVAVFLATFTFVHWGKTDAALKPHPSLVVGVTASKWQWSFFYPAYGINEALLMFPWVG